MATMDPNHERRALLYLIDVVESLAGGMAHGQTPDSEWFQQLQDDLERHRRELHGEVVAWPQDE